MPNKADGYATAAAITVCLALGLILTALTAQSVLSLRYAQIYLRQTQIDFVLRGVQVKASQVLASASNAGRLEYRTNTSFGSVSVIGEREQDKLPLSHGIALADLKRLGVAEPNNLSARLIEASSQKRSPADIEALDPSRLWKLCAPSLLSAFGTGKTLQLAPPSPPQPSGSQLKLGEVWRLRARLPDGWTDDRTVRFIGNTNTQAATIWHRLIKQTGDIGQCDALQLGSKP